MSGTKEGGAKAAAQNKLKYGKDFYKKIGSKGGKLGVTGGFASDKVGADGLSGRERAKVAGSKGGQISKRERDYKAGFEVKSEVKGVNYIAEEL